MQSKKLSRKGFLSWGVAFTSLLVMPAFLRHTKQAKDKRTVKMLTQDGKLVEIEVDHIPFKKEKIINADIFKWINRKTSSF